MKKIVLSLAVLASTWTHAQEIVPENNVWIGTNQIYGSARFQGLGGAMGAIGGDGSAVSLNPAGSGLFNYNQFSISGVLDNKKFETTYLGNTTTSKENNFHLPNISAFFTHDTKAESGVTKVNFGFTYQTQQRFDSYTVSQGENSQSAVEYFLSHANNGYNNGSVPLDLVQTLPNETIGDLYDYLNGEPFGFSAQQAMLGYQAYLINDLANGTYESNMAPGTYYQENIASTSGFSSKLTGNIALELNKKLYLGANLNVHFTDLLRSTSFYEENLSNISTGVKRYEFNNSTYTYGNGFSFQLGGIFKATEQLRIGATYQSPTWNSLRDEFTQNLYSQYFDEGTLKNANVDPNIVTLYDTYKVVTPGSLTGSLAYVFGKNGLISIDYQYKDYSKTKYKDDMGAFALLNDYYARELQATNDIRVGGEYRLNNVSLRVGYRFANSPYKTQDVIGDLNSVSAGIGYSYGTSRIDFGYTFAHQPVRSLPLTSGISQEEMIRTKNNLFNLSYTVSF